jgi:hypothetical protein
MPAGAISETARVRSARPPGCSRRQCRRCAKPAWRRSAPRGRGRAEEPAGQRAPGLRPRPGRDGPPGHRRQTQIFRCPLCLSPHEYQALVRLAEALPFDIKVCIVAGRGLGDRKLYRLPTEELKFDDVTRCRGNIRPCWLPQPRNSATTARAAPASPGGAPTRSCARASCSTRPSPPCQNPSCCRPSSTAPPCASSNPASPKCPEPFQSR